MAWIEKEGRTVEEATEAAIAATGRSREELEIEVIREGAKGLFGLGGEPALVRARPREEARDVRGAFRDEGPEGRGAAPTTTEVEPREVGPSAVAPEPTPAERTEPPRVEPEVPRVAEAADAEPGDEAELREEARQVAVEMVQGILDRMKLEGEVTSAVDDKTVQVDVYGEDMGILIGRGGSTLEALQELVRAGVQRRVKARQSVVVDVEGYWERRRSRQRRGGSKGERR